MKKYSICNLNFQKKVQNNPDETKFVESFVSLFQTTDVGFVKIGRTEYLLKKEYYVQQYPIMNKIYKFINLDVSEYKFYKKYSNKIRKSKFKNHIQLPYQYEFCNKMTVYLYKKIDYDLTSFFIKTLSKSSFYSILIQACNTVFYINHTLKIFHNDLSMNNKLRNFMVNKKKDSYQVIIIDFGLASKELKLKNKQFYQFKAVKYFYTFPIESELLLVFYLFLIQFYSKKELHFYKLYQYFYEKIKSKTLLLFDSEIIKEIRSFSNFQKIVSSIVV